MILNSEFQSGDLVFCHSKGFVGKSIRFIQHLHGDDDWEYNHVALLNEKQANGDWAVIQAEAHGVTSDKLLSSVAPGGFYEVVALPQGVDRDKVLEFARAEVGCEYGFITIASIVFTLWTPNAINVIKGNTWICSALAGEALRAGGWIHKWPDVYQVRPAQLLSALPATA